MKKTLILSKQYPFPETTGGKMRTANFVRYFKRLGPTDIAFSQPKEAQEDAINPFERECFIERSKYPTSFGDRAKELLNGRPYPLYIFRAREERKLFEFIESGDYDYIFVRYIVNAYNLFHLHKIQRKKIILDFDDMISGTLYETFFDNNVNIYKRFIRNLNKLALLRYENKCLNLGMSIFTSKLDIERVANKCKFPFLVPNIYNNNRLEKFDFGIGFENDNTILFIGTLTYNPNIEGLKWFINDIFPSLKKNINDIKLLVVGHADESNLDEISRLCNDESIELHTNVPDVKEYYQRARVVVVPLLQGGGTRIKILEAALASRPVLSTPVGAEGLGLVDRKNVFLFNNTNEFLQAFAELENKAVYIKTIQGAQNFVKKEFSENTFIASMDKVIKEMDTNLSVN